MPASIVIGLVGAGLFWPTWGLSGPLVYVGLALAVAGVCSEPRRGEAWIAIAVNVLCLGALFLITWTPTALLALLVLGLDGNLGRRDLRRR